MRTNKNIEKRADRHVNTVVALSVALTAAVFAAVCFLSAGMLKKTELENIYQKSYYDASENLQNIETKLAKLAVTNSASSQNKTASEIWRQAAEAESGLSQLPLDHNDLRAATRFVNQLSDYSNSLAKKTAAGKPLTDGDIEQVEKLLSTCRSLNSSVGRLGSKLGSGYRITNHIDADKLKKGMGSRLGDDFKDVNENSIEYPKMIYDGPFSDSLMTNEYKALEGLPATTKDDALAALARYLPDASDIEYLGLAGGDKATHELTATLAGRSLYAQLTEKGALPVMMSADCDTKTPVLSESDAKSIAVDTAKRLLGTDMICVWDNVLEGVGYFNLAPQQDGAVLYPDLVKVKLCMRDGALSGFEATSYLKNHAPRAPLAPMLTETEARARVSNRLEVENGRLAVIPKGESSETLAYEFFGDYNDHTYVVYINAVSGAEEDVQMIINNAHRGRMLG